MGYANPLAGLLFGELFRTLLPDLVLAFALFTSLAYAALSRRFDRQRPAVAVSAAVGLALAIGLVWWELENGYSIRDLGPLAVGFGLFVLAAVLYQSLRRVGGSWAGAALAFGSALLVGTALGIDWPAERRLVHTVTFLMLTLGVVAFLLHHRSGEQPAWPAFAGGSGERETPPSHPPPGELHADRNAAEQLTGRLGQIKEEARWLRRRPETAEQVRRRLQQALPEAGWLTERLAKLREKARLAVQGQLDRIQELRKEVWKMPPAMRERAIRELQQRYKQLKLETRLERLDGAVAEAERRIRALTQEAEQQIERHEFQRLSRTLDDAAKLQKHVSSLIAAIERSEARLMKACREAAEEARGER